MSKLLDECDAACLVSELLRNQAILCCDITLTESRDRNMKLQIMNTLKSPKNTRTPEQVKYDAKVGKHAEQAVDDIFYEANAFDILTINDEEKTKNFYWDLIIHGKRFDIKKQNTFNRLRISSYTTNKILLERANSCEYLITVVPHQLHWRPAYLISTKSFAKLGVNAHAYGYPCFEHPMSELIKLDLAVPLNDELCKI